MRVRAAGACCGCVLQVRADYECDIEFLDAGAGAGACCGCGPRGSDCGER